MSWTTTTRPRQQTTSANGTIDDVLAVLRKMFRWPSTLVILGRPVEQRLREVMPYEVARTIDAYVRKYAATMLAPHPLTGEAAYQWLRDTMFAPTNPLAIHWATAALGVSEGIPRLEIRPAATVSEWWLWQESGNGRDGQPWEDPTEPDRIAEWARRRALAESVPLEWQIAGAHLHWQLCAREGMEPPPLADVRGKDAQVWMESLK